MWCRSCDKPNHPSNVFCTSCGEQLGVEPPTEEGEPDFEASRKPSHNQGPVKEGPTLVESLMGRSDSSDDLAQGQVVIIAARWILVVAGLMLALWNPDAIGDLRIQIVLILALAVGNFYLHAQVLMGRPVIAPVVLGASAADIVVISSIIAAQGGFESHLYVFYFPALLALSVAFRTQVTVAFTGAAIAIYGLIALAAASPDDGQVLITRLLMLAGVAMCGNAYWRIERDRRNAAAEPLEELQARRREKVPTS